MQEARAISVRNSWQREVPVPRSVPSSRSLKQYLGGGGCTSCQDVLSLLAMRWILITMVGLVGLLGSSVSAQAPQCHALGKGFSSVDIDGNSLGFECWHTTVFGGLASDH